MITRIDFMMAAAYALTDQECQDLFGVDRDNMFEGVAKWNQNLEIAYNEFCSNDDIF